MMPLYDRESFDKSIIPDHFKKDVREVLQVAVALGWKLHVTSNNSVTIISPEERKKYHFGRRTSTSLNRVRRDVFKYGDPELVAKADQILDGKADPEGVLGLPVIGPDNVVDDRPTPADMPQRSVTEPPPHIISEKPMVAKASEGKAYNSEVAVERLWSDGHTDYKCTRCSFSSEKRLSIRGHFQVHTRASGEKSQRPQAYKAEVPDAAKYKPRQSRIDALAEQIRVMLDQGKTDPQEIARTSLMWVHEQSRKGTGLAAEREEMTDSDIITRIRSLLDDGTQYRMRQELETQAVELSELRQRLERAEAEAENARSTLKAFTDLATELSAGKEAS